MIVRATLLLSLCTFGGCHGASLPHDSGVEPDSNASVDYDPNVGQPFDQPIALDDARVEAIDPSELPVSNAPCREPIRARVTSVIDGDTFWVSGLSEQLSVKIRVIGIDTPELAHQDQPQECFANESTSFTKQLEGHQVWLTFDAECVDSTASMRTLAYVWTGIGPQDSWERQQLRRGFARAYPFGDNRSFAGQFATDETMAQTVGAGMWSACR